MTNNRFTPAFTPDCTKGETIFGWIWLLVHMFALPLLLAVLVSFYPDMGELTMNIAYYGLSLAVVMIVFMKLLRREFDHLLDRLFHCIYIFFAGYFLWYLLSMAMVSIMTALNLENTTPNDQFIDTLAAESYNLVLVISVIAAPLVEEVLFRGILFQSVRKRSKLWAYIASIGLFGLYHTWQFALVYQDPVYLLYSLQYIPITFALTWSYERSGSLWVPIFIHGTNNLLAMQLVQMM